MQKCGVEQKVHHYFQTSFYVVNTKYWLLIDCRLYLEGSIYITRALQFLPFIGIQIAHLQYALYFDFAFVSCISQQSHTIMLF